VTLTQGIDLSHHQAPTAVPWERIGAECSFVICRATYGTMRDRQVAEHLRRARAVGAQVGLYHFFRAVQRLDDQLAAFSAAAEAAGYQPGDIVPAIDVEDDPKVADVAPAWAPSVHALALAMQERYGAKPLIYITQRDWHRAGKPLWMLEHPLWVAHYTGAAKPATPGNVPWLIWQNRVGPFQPGGPGGLHQPGLFDHNLCCGELPTITRVTSGATPPLVTAPLEQPSEPSWEELRHRVELTQALWFDSQLHPDDDDPKPAA
jgi:hypothetical protein